MNSVDRLQVQSVGKVEEAPVSGFDMSEEPMESRVQSGVPRVVVDQWY